MKICKKELSLGLAIVLGLSGLQACKKQENSIPSPSEEINQISSENKEKDKAKDISSDFDTTPQAQKEYEMMTKEEKISYLEDKIFNIRVKARSLEMKLEENPQYSDEDKENIQKSIDQTDVLIEKINQEIDELE